MVLACKVVETLPSAVSPDAETTTGLQIAAELACKALMDCITHAEQGQHFVYQCIFPKIKPQSKPEVCIDMAMKAKYFQAIFALEDSFIDCVELDQGGFPQKVFKCDLSTVLAKDIEGLKLVHNFLCGGEERKTQLKWFKNKDDMKGAVREYWATKMPKTVREKFEWILSKKHWGGERHYGRRKKLSAELIRAHEEWAKAKFCTDEKTIHPAEMQKRLCQVYRASQWVFLQLIEIWTKKTPPSFLLTSNLANLDEPVDFERVPLLDFDGYAEQQYWKQMKFSETCDQGGCKLEIAYYPQIEDKNDDTILPVDSVAPTNESSSAAIAASIDSQSGHCISPSERAKRGSKQKERGQRNLSCADPLMPVTAPSASQPPSLCLSGESVSLATTEAAGQENLVRKPRKRRRGRGNKDKKSEAQSAQPHQHTTESADMEPNVQEAEHQASYEPQAFSTTVVEKGAEERSPAEWTVDEDSPAASDDELGGQDFIFASSGDGSEEPSSLPSLAPGDDLQRVGSDSQVGSFLQPIWRRLQGFLYR